MSFLTLLLIPVVLLGIVFLPSILGVLIYPVNVCRIRSRCRKMDVSDVEIKAWPDHYGITFHKDGQKLYAKCTVGRRIRWLGKSPEEF
jgi:hypothetical protein